MSTLNYFAYGSNMSIARLHGRTPSAVLQGCCRLNRHDLRFHKRGHDGSSKADAYFTGDDHDVIHGALFTIERSEKPNLDAAEGLGNGYELKQVMVIDGAGFTIPALTYVATQFDVQLKPYSWYLNHVLVGALELGLPEHYIHSKISTVTAVDDGNWMRDREQRRIHQ